MPTITEQRVEIQTHYDQCLKIQSDPKLSQKDLALMSLQSKMPYDSFFDWQQIFDYDRSIDQKIGFERLETCDGKFKVDTLSVLTYKELCEVYRRLTGTVTILPSDRSPHEWTIVGCGDAGSRYLSYAESKSRFREKIIDDCYCYFCDYVCGHRIFKCHKYKETEQSSDDSKRWCVICFCEGKKSYSECFGHSYYQTKTSMISCQHIHYTKSKKYPICPTLKEKTKWWVTYRSYRDSFAKDY